MATWDAPIVGAGPVNCERLRMKVLINSTAILSLTLYVVPPFAAQAQDLPMADVGGQAVICLPDDQAVCEDGATCVIAGPEDCQTTAEAAISAGTAIAGTGVTAAETLAATAEVAPAEEAPVAEEPVAEEPVAEEPAAEPAPDASADATMAADPEAQAEVATEEPAAEATTEEPAAEAMTEATTEAPAEAQAEVATEEPAAEATAEATAEEPAAEATVEATAEATADTTAEAPAVDPAMLPTAMVGDQSVICLPDAAAPCPEGNVCVVADADTCQATAEATLAAPADTAPESSAEATAEAPVEAAPVAPLTEEEVAAQAAQDEAAIAAAQKAQEEAAAAALADPNLQPVEAPVAPEAAVESLTQTLDAAPAPDATASAEGSEEATAVAAPTVAAATEAAIDPNAAPTEQPVAADATTTTETVTEADTRAAAQEFSAAPVEVAPGKKSGLSDLEKAGLVALGALAIGTMLNNGNKQVVQNTGDRVVVRQDDGSYVVYKDDNALLREPGSKVTTQTFQDGSTRTIVARADGSQIATIRDASGRVLQRVAYDTKGRATVLIDDLKPEEPIRVSQLPKPRGQRIDVNAGDAAMAAALAAAEAEDVGARFSLRQIRTIPEVRHLAPTIDVKEITFNTGSAALTADQARSLNALGKFMAGLIAQNPGEVFLVEGHTDAVGSAASNLTLSDRRAETVAKALTEYFGVPPENMVVQGYGESELLIPTAGDERANRRVSLRIITPLLRK